MKTMTCNQLGGPESCDLELKADSFEEMARLSKEHGMEMFQKGDEAHIKVMEDMKGKMNEPDAMGKWMSEKKSLFDNLVDD